MKTFAELEVRLQHLLVGLDGEFWTKILYEIDPPKNIPGDQAILDMVFRDCKAVSGYIPDLMALMRKHVPQELADRDIKSLTAITGIIQIMTRILLMILLVPRYNDHEDLITTFNGYRQTLVFVGDYLKEITNKA